MVFLSTIALLLSLVLPSTCRLGLWPQPERADSGGEVIWADPGLHAVLRCGNDSQHVVLSGEPSQHVILQALFQWQQSILDYTRRDEQTASDTSLSEEQVLNAAVRDCIKQIQQTKFVPWKFYPRGSSFEPSSTGQHPSIVVLEIDQGTCPAHHMEPSAFFGGEETYEIHLEGRTARITAASSIGTLRALGKF
jgi:hexosaminidase